MYKYLYVYLITHSFYAGININLVENEENSIQRNLCTDFGIKYILLVKLASY